MAERRMFARTIIDSDAFLDMPLSAQALYFHLSMRADDDGFINNPKKIQRMVGASDDDCKLLVMKRFVLVFESGVIVIKHWKIHNYIRNDRYKPTIYKEEMAQLEEKDNKGYTEKKELGIPNGYQMETQVRLGKDRLELGKDNVVEEQASPPRTPKKPQKNKYGEFQNVLLTETEFENLANSFGIELRDKAISFLDEYIEEKGYKSKSHNLAIRRWVIDALKERENKPQRYGKKVPMGASGQLGQAELEAIHKVLGTPYVKQEPDANFEAEAERMRQRIQEVQEMGMKGDI